RSIQRGEPGRMRKQLRRCYLFFPGLRKLRPELNYALRDVDLIFLERVQDAGAAESFRRRPNQNERVGCPRFFAARIAKAAVQLDNRLSILPNGNGRTKLAKLVEILSKERLDSSA